MPSSLKKRARLSGGSRTPEAPRGDSTPMASTRRSLSPPRAWSAISAPFETPGSPPRNTVPSASRRCAEPTDCASGRRSTAIAAEGLSTSWSAGAVLRGDAQPRAIERADTRLPPRRTAARGVRGRPVRPRADRPRRHGDRRRPGDGDIHLVRVAEDVLVALQLHQLDGHRSGTTPARSADGTPGVAARPPGVTRRRRS